MTLDELFQKRKEQCKALKEGEQTEETKAELAKREGQMEMYSAKLKAIEGIERVETQEFTMETL